MTAAGLRVSDHPQLGVTLPRVTRSEWIKFRSLRSTWFSVGAALLASIGLGILFSALRGHDLQSHFQAGDVITEDFPLVTLRGTFLAQLAIGILGVLTITGEYSTGMIRATLGAVPRRVPVLIGKIAVFAGVIFVVSTIAAVIAFLAGQAVLHSYGFGVSITSPGALRAILGDGLYLMLVGVFGLGIGFAVRNTGGAIAVLVGMMLVLPLLAQALPGSLSSQVSRYLPMLAGTAVMNTRPAPDQLAPWPGLGVFACYMAVSVVVGLFVLRRRDA